MNTGLSPRAMMSLLTNGTKAVDVLTTSLELGLLDALEPGGVTLAELSEKSGAVPGRLYKLLECLEALGFLRHQANGDDLAGTRYWPVPGLREAAVDVFGPTATERDRDGYPWRLLQGRLDAVLYGSISLPDDAFSWPPKDAEQLARFERSMAAGIGPIAETFDLHARRLWGTDPVRLLDVGGGDGTLAAGMLARTPSLRVDVYNLAAAEPLVRRSAAGIEDRLGFVAGDFQKEELPIGYDAMSFVRVLHDWPVATARELLHKAYTALPIDGRVLICEEFRDGERLARQFFWSYFLMGIDTCVSRLYEVGHYRRLLADIGFHDIAVLSGPFELITAVKAA